MEQSQSLKLLNQQSSKLLGDVAALQTQNELQKEELALAKKVIIGVGIVAVLETVYIILHINGTLK
jgi:hypothetical protein